MRSLTVARACRRSRREESEGQKDEDQSHMGRSLVQNVATRRDQRASGCAPSRSSLGEDGGRGVIAASLELENQMLRPGGTRTSASPRSASARMPLMPVSGSRNRSARTATAWRSSIRVARVRRQAEPVRGELDARDRSTRRRSASASLCMCATRSPNLRSASVAG